ncbi:MAG: beta-ketoacyl-[acyl-carrier-protein] synthase family protein [Bacillota bacterium]
MKKCVVTGLGIVCSIGNNLDEVWNNAVNGVCGIKEVSTFDTSNCYAKIGAEASSFRPTFKKAELYSKRMDRVSLLCIEAVNEAFINSGLSIEDIDKKRLGVVIGSCTGGAISAEKFHRQLLDNSERVSPREILKIPIHAIASNVAFFLRAHGVVANIGNACAAGTMSIAYACDLIKRGLADVVVAGGADTFASLPFSGFHALKALDTIPCSPFGRSKGISLGEGTGAVIVESIEHAQKRNAKILCEVSGYGITSDAYHITAPNPEGEGQMTALRLALKEASFETYDIDYVNAHGTGTPLNDSAEGTSLAEIFKNEIDKIKISSSKSMVGHCLGAAGAVEAVLSIKALTCNTVPPTVNYPDLSEAMEEAAAVSAFDLVPNKGKDADVNVVMSNSFAFGGNNASIIFSKDLKKDNHTKEYNKRVFVTGIGIVSTIGIGIDEYWKNISEGKSGINAVTYKDKKYKSKFAASANLTDFASYGISPSELRKLDRITKLLLVSGKISLKDANINVNDDVDKDIGIIVGTSDGPATEIGNFQEGMIKRGYHAASALIFPNTVYNAAGGYLSIMTKIKGHTATLVNGIQSGISSICYGYDLIKMQKQKYAIASGVDEYSETIHILYDKLRALAAGDDYFSYPYSFNQKGFILGEGSTSLMLESEDEVNKRGSHCYAEIVGYGLTNTPVAPGKIDFEGYGLDRAIIMACEQAEIKPSDIDAVVGFGNGCERTDAMELNSYKRIFTESFSTIPLHSIKALTGEGRAATSALQVAHAALMLDRQQGPVTRREFAASAKCGENECYLSETPAREYKYILVTSFAYGGSYAAILLKKANGDF